MFKPKQIIILAIETSADETSAAVAVGDTKTKTVQLLSNIVYSQIRKHRKTGGIVPEVAARAHIPKIIPAIKLALAQARVHLKNIDCLAVTTGPGLITSLMVGVDTAKALAFALDKPIIPINHLEGHLLSALPLSNSYKLKAKSYFPALGLIVSGGHTMLVLILDLGQYQILGQTLDDAAGECFDKIAKILGLSYPGGPALAKLARKGNPLAFDFPRPMINQHNFNFSFAGLKTAVLYFLRDYPSPSRGGKDKRKFPSLEGRGKGRVKLADIAASVEQAIVDVLVEKTIHAAQKNKVKAVLIGGGVAANQKLRQSLKQRLKKEIPSSDLRLPTSNLTTDNAGMIALTAFYHYLFGDIKTFDKIKADPNLMLKSWG